MTDINRKINQAKGWRQLLPNGGWTLDPPGEERGWTPEDDLPDWLGSDEANCRLLDEMPNPVLQFLGKPLGWECWYDYTHGSWSNCNGDRRTAVCLAWLKWKGETA